MRKFGKIVVRGEVIDLDAEFGDLTARNLNEGMVTTSALMGRVAALWGAAEGELIEVDAEYRHWRAKFGENILGGEEKLPEWKVKQQVEASEEFLTAKRKVAQTENAVVTLKGLFTALDERGSQLQSRGAMARAELDATGMHTPEHVRDELSEADDGAERPPPRPPAARKDVRGIMGKKPPPK